MMKSHTSGKNDGNTELLASSFGTPLGIILFLSTRNISWDLMYGRTMIQFMHLDKVLQSFGFSHSHCQYQLLYLVASVLLVFTFLKVIFGL